MANQAAEMRLSLRGSLGDVSAFLLRPTDAWLLYVLAHGAGAGMRHPFLEKISAALAARGIASFRYQFPYMEAARRRPDPPASLEATVEAAVTQAAELAPELPLVAGGKSLGGRMTSSAAASGLLARVRGLVFLGFPLHPPGRPGTHRADHLQRVDLPMLFLQGTRDGFARLDLITDVVGALGGRAELHLIDEADHSFAVLKRTGRSPEQVINELADVITGWARSLIAGGVRA
jgi:predicted alpha/beta-hydrolase family hydrolase